MAEFIVEDRNGVRRVPIGTQMTIGRSERNDLALNAMFTSRRHAWVWRQGDRVILEDLGSTNGTYVNGQRLAAAQFLRHNDLITLGDAQIWYVDRWEPAAERTPPGGTPQVQLQPVFCPRCRMPNQPQAEFCRRCGAPLRESGERTQPGRSHTPTDPVIARPFPTTESPPAPPRQGASLLILLLALVAVLLLAILGLLAYFALL